MKRMLIVLTAALLLTLTAGFALAQTPEIEEKMAQAAELRDQMANTSDPDEYARLKEQYDALAQEIESLVAAQQADAQARSQAIAEYNNGNKLLRQRNFSGAIEAFKRSAELNPMEARTFYSLGLAHRYNRQYGEAMAAFDKAIQLDSKYVKAYYAKGITLNSMREFGQAVETFRRAVQVEGADPGELSKAFTGLGLAYYYQKNYEQAITALQQATNLDASNADAFYNLGKAYGDSNQMQQAADAIQQAVALDSNNEKYLTALAEKLNKLGRHQQAAAAAEQATQASANYAAAWFELGWARQHMGQDDPAIAAYEKAMADRTYRQPAEYQIRVIRDEF